MKDRDKDRVTVRCMNGIDLNYQTEPMSRVGAELLIEGIERVKTCTLPHTIHHVEEH